MLHGFEFVTTPVQHTFDQCSAYVRALPTFELTKRSEWFAADSICAFCKIELRTLETHKRIHIYIYIIYIAGETDVLLHGANYG